MSPFFILTQLPNNLISLMLRLCLALLFSLPLWGEKLFDNAPIYYTKTKAKTPLTEIFQGIESGESLLRGESDREILAELLTALDVPVESQLLVFSKTSAQNARISPTTPRALYYSQNAYLSWVQNGDIEAITFDAKLGAIFHTIDLNRRKKGQTPQLRREGSCLNCHASSATEGVPGLLVRSVYPDAIGRSIFDWRSFHTTHHSPVVDRWGGWYVTGQSGPAHHLGNSVFTLKRERRSLTESRAINDLSPFIDTKPYLGGGSSDVVSLLIFEHQITVHNIILSAQLATQRLFFQHPIINAPLSNKARQVLDYHRDQIVSALLFEDEFELVNDDFKGSEDFQKAFAKSARTTKEGHSLRDLLLHERLFKYRCSYLIYSDPFTHLHPVLKREVLTKLQDILLHPHQHPDFGYLSKSERKHILTILAETLPAWKELPPIPPK